MDPASRPAPSGAMIAAAALVGFAAGVECTVAAVLWLGGHVPALGLLGGAAAAVLVAFAALRGGSARRQIAAAMALAAVVLLVAPLLAATTYDVSWDGQAYHQLGIWRLAEGWNPFRRPLPAAFGTMPFYVNHYAKGAWLRGSVLFLAYGDIEAAKGWTFVFAATAGLAVAAAARRLGVASGWSVAVGVLAAANPVASTQLLTDYVDGQLASVLTAACGLAIAALAGGGAVPLIGLAACGLLLTGLKFTGIVYALVLAAFAGAAAWRASHRRAVAIAGAMAVAVAVGVGFVGWNPYVTNWRERGHPFYPLAGPGALDVVTPQAVPSFLARSRLERLAISVFSRSANERDEPPELKVPFTVGPETALFALPDVRIGGFGPLFSGALVLAVLALALAAWRPPRAAPALGAVVAGALLASALVNPHAWWARYAPQVWLVPIALALGAAAARARVPAAVAALALAVLVVDAGLVAVNAVHRGRRRSAAVAAQLRALSRAPDPVSVDFDGFEALRHRFRVAGVRFVDAAPLPCAAPALVEATPVPYCPPPQAR